MEFLRTVLGGFAGGVATFVLALLIMMCVSGPAAIREAKARTDYYRRKEGARPLSSWPIYRFKIWLTCIGTILVIVAGYFLYPYLVYGAWLAALVWLWLDDLMFQYHAREHEKIRRYSTE